jgi:hypothetical protein
MGRSAYSSPAFFEKLRFYFVLRILLVRSESAKAKFAAAVHGKEKSLL